jgi:branched-chain amino acid transport system ATP-binding protein
MNARAKPDHSALSVRNLDAWIGNQQILHSVTFDVGEGVTALLGRNGVGKTTTLRALLGLVRRCGEVLLAGDRIDDLPTHAVVVRGVGYVPENREVFGSLTVAENLTLAARTPHPDLDTVHHLFPELRERAKQAAGTLSGGQQQMVALARALINDNTILLIDEPTKGLAPRIVEEVAAALRVAAARTPILLVEQDLAVVETLADDVVVIADGRVAHRGPARDFLADQAAVTSLLGVGTREVTPS